MTEINYAAEAYLRGLGITPATITRYKQEGVPEYFSDGERVTDDQEQLQPGGDLVERLEEILDHDLIKANTLVQQSGGNRFVWANYRAGRTAPPPAYFWGLILHHLQQAKSDWCNSGMSRPEWFKKYKWFKRNKDQRRIATEFLIAQVAEILDRIPA